MSQNKDLQKAIRQMADGSKSGFYTFYLGSSQFVYSSALLLCKDHKTACRFMVDFYQYLYLHLPEYTPSQDLEKWISRLIMERFSQLSIGKNIKQPSVREQISAGTAELEKSERERVWRLLEEHMHFPKETPKKRGGSRVLPLFAVLLLLLLAFHFRAPILEKLQNAVAQIQQADEETADSDEADGEDELLENQPEYPGSEAASPDDLTSLDLFDRTSDTDSEPSSFGNMPTADEPTVSTPSTDTPTADAPTVDTPTVNTPTVNSPISDQDSGRNSSGSGNFSDLENLELESHYGDSLTPHETLK